MKKLINTEISPEIAELAVEKGFDRFKVQQPVMIPMEDGTTYEYYPVVTQAFLQLWLREVHNIHIEIEPSWLPEELDQKLAKPAYSPWVMHDWQEEDEPAQYYKTYEEAMEVALYEGLHLIKI